MGTVILREDNLKNIKRGIRKKNQVLENGYRYLAIWEKDIHEDVSSLLDQEIFENYPLND